MKAIKFLVLAAGLAGIAAFFLPLIAVTDGKSSVTISGMNAITGIDSISDVTDGKVTGQEADAAVADLNKAFDDIKLIVLAVFAPAVMCALFGLIGVIKGSFGRGLGIGALLFGLVGLAVWALLNAAGDKFAAESGVDAKGIGLWLLMVSSAGCAVGGLLALIKPERGAAARPSRYAATIKA